MEAKELIDRVGFSDATYLNESKSYQEVYFDGLHVGGMTSKIINYLLPLSEFFISVNLTKEQIDSIPGYRVDDSEDKGYFQICLKLDSKKEDLDLCELCEKIYNVIKK